jgi:NADH-quinone oxidoreductase subunit J
MAWNALFFYLLGIISVLAAIGMVAVRNPVHSAIFLVLTLFNTAGIFVMLGAEFLAAAQVIVYAGAVLVLMLFFLMLIDPQKLPERGGGTRCNESSVRCWVSFCSSRWRRRSPTGP